MKIHPSVVIEVDATAMRGAGKGPCPGYGSSVSTVGLLSGMYVAV
jgi:hypothetical protein